MKFTHTILLGLVGFTVAAPAGLKRETTSISTSTQGLTSDSTPGSRTTDHRLEIQLPAGEDPADMHADYRRQDETPRADDNPIDIHPDYRRQADTPPTDDGNPIDIHPDYRRQVDATPDDSKPIDIHPEYRRQTNVETEAEEEQDPSIQQADY